MIKKLTLTDFYGTTRTYDFGQIITLRGPNGAGKTTVEHAICFALAGTDAVGTRAPVHLISTGKDRCEVEVETSKGAVIKRSLTSAKNGTLTLDRAGAVTNLSQTQLESMIAPSDVLRSIFIPGYFFSSAMTPEKRRKVLADILPSVDRVAILGELMGEPIPEAWVPVYGLDTNKRADIIASNIANSRRTLDTQIAHIEGQLREVNNVEEIPPEPVAPIAIAKLEQNRKAEDAWADYRHRYRTWESAQLRFERVADDNAKRTEKKEQLEEQLRTVGDEGAPVSPVPRELVAEERKLLGSRLHAPTPPLAAQLPSTDTCGTCGQTVGKKHRERVSAENEKRLAEYNEQLAAVEKHNGENEKMLAEVRAQIETHRRRIEEGEAHNRGVQLKRDRIRAELGAMREEIAEDPGTKPMQPMEVALSEDEKQKLIEEERSYQRARAIYDQAVKRGKSAGSRADGLELEIASLRERADRARRLEQCVKALPQEELKRQADALKMNGYVLDVSGKDVAFYHEDGRPFGILSRGESMKACNALSIKLDSLLPRKINMIFVDNAEAIDDPRVNELADNGRQVFLAYVDKSCDGLVVS